MPGYVAAVFTLAVTQKFTDVHRCHSKIQLPSVLRQHHAP